MIYCVGLETASNGFISNHCTKLQHKSISVHLIYQLVKRNLVSLQLYRFVRLNIKKGALNQLTDLVRLFHCYLVIGKDCLTSCRPFHQLGLPWVLLVQGLLLRLLQLLTVKQILKKHFVVLNALLLSGQ